MKALRFIVKFVWQAPQSLVGLLVWLWCIGRNHIILYHKEVVFIVTTGVSGGVSLGNFVFVDPANALKVASFDHEFGHCKQSLYLGPLYLLIVGIASVMNVWFNPNVNGSYYNFWTERWANKLGSVPDYVGKYHPSHLPEISYSFVKSKIDRWFSDVTKSD